MNKLTRFLKRFLLPYYKELLKSIIRKFLFKRRKRFIKNLYSFPSYIQGKEDLRLIIFLVLDCLRRDHLSLYGYERDTTPFIKKIGQDAAVFTDAISPSNWTYPSVLSILSGLYPHNHGGFINEKTRNFSKNMLPMKPHRKSLLIQDIFALLNFDTFFLSSVATSGLPIEGTFTFHEMTKKDASFVVDNTIKYIKSGRRKKFFYIQLGDIHHPINPPEKFRNHFGEVKKLPNIEGWDYLHNPDNMDDDFIEFRENKIRLYDATLYFLDTSVSKLFYFLKSENLLKETLVVIMADHGEEFWEHKDMEKKYFFDPRGFYGCGHGHSFFQEVIAVPLILYGHGIKKGNYNYRVTLVDITPTILDMLNLKQVKNFDGINLFNYKENRLILSEENAYGYERGALFYKKYKMHYSPFDYIEWVFDLSKDLYERYPLRNKDFPEFATMCRYLDGIQKKSSGEIISVDEEIKKQLTQIGYF